MKPTFQHTVARLQNAAAPEIFSRGGPPPPLRSRGLPDENGQWTPPAKIAKPKGTLTDPMLLAALAAASPIKHLVPPIKHGLLAYYPLPPVFKNQTEQILMLSCSPPQFRMPKKGPNAGKAVEIKRKITIITRTVTGGDGVEYTFSNRSTAIKVSTGLKLLRTELRATFARRWPAKAADLTAFLLMADLEK